MILNSSHSDSLDCLELLQAASQLLVVWTIGFTFSRDHPYCLHSGSQLLSPSFYIIGASKRLNISWDSPEMLTSLASSVGVSFLGVICMAATFWELEVERQEGKAVVSICSLTNPGFGRLLPCLTLWVVKPPLPFVKPSIHF
jgi:hypothetical protein